MNFEKTKNSTRTLVFGMINRLITIVLPFITRTIIIYKLGTEYAGLNSLFTSILSVLSISELGIGSAIIFCLYEPVARDDKDEIRAMLSLLRKLYWIIGIVILFLGLMAMPFLKYFIKSDYPIDLNLYILFFIYLLNSSISYLTCAYKSVIFNVYQRGDIAHNIDSVSQIFKYTAQIIFLLLFANYYIYVLMLLLATILTNILTGIISNKKYKDLFPAGKVSKKTKKVIQNKVMYLAAHSITSKLLNSADSIIISSFIGLSVLGIYGNYNYIATSLIGLILILYGSVRAAIGNSIYTKSHKSNLKIYNSLWALGIWISTWCSITMFCLYQPFMKLWVGENNLLPIYTVLFIVLYFHANACNQFFTSTYISVAGLWNKTLSRQIIAVVMNLLLDIILVQYFGVCGIVFASFITTVLVSYPFDIFITYKYILKERVGIGFRKAVVNYLFLIGLGGLSYFLCSIIPGGGIANLILRTVVCLTVPNGVYLLCIKDTDEFKFIIEHLNILIKR